MNPSVAALRTITAVTFQRLLFWIGIAVGAILVLLVGLTIYLGGWVSSWWFLLLIVLTPLIIFAAAIAAAFSYLANRLLPRKLSRQERAVVHAFIGKLMSLAEVRATPWPVMAFLIGKDVIRGRASGYIDSIVQDASGLRKNFEQIRALFDKKELK